MYLKVQWWIKGSWVPQDVLTWPPGSITDKMKENLVFTNEVLGAGSIQQNHRCFI